MNSLVFPDQELSEVAELPAEKKSEVVDLFATAFRLR